MSKIAKLTLDRFTGTSGGVIAGSLLFLLWLAYFLVPRANLFVSSVAGLILLMVLFRYPLIGTCVVTLILASNLSAILPTGFVLPLMALTCLFVILRRLMAGVAAIPWNPLLIGFLVFATLNFISMTWAATYDGFEAMVYIRSLVLIVLVLLTVERPAHLTWVIVAAGIGLIISTAITVQHMLTFFSSGNLVEAGIQNGIEKSRYFGYWADPNVAGMSAVPVVALCFAVARTKGALMLRLIAGLAVLCGLVTVVLSQSRGAGLTLLLCAGIFFTADRLRWPLIGLTLASILVVISLVRVDFLGRMATIGKGRGEASIAQRAEIASGAIQMFEDHFPLGVGSGNSKVYSRDYSFTVKWGIPAHDAYLDTLAELGILGPFLLLASILTVLPAVKVSRWHIDSLDFRQTSGMAMLAAFLTILLGEALGSWGPYPLFWLILAVISTREWVFRKEDAGNSELTSMKESY